MPLYEYKCLKCGDNFEEIRKFSDPPLTKHENCGGELRRLLSPPAIQFKGTGWYVTDYSRRNSTLSEQDTDSSPKPDQKHEVSKTESTQSEKTEGTAVAAPKEE